MTEIGVDRRARKLFWTKLRAVLAGGLVLGVGASITLAAWTDQEFAKGTFKSGSFAIEGSVDGGNAWSHQSSTADAAPLNFSVGADRLVRNESVYAGYAVRLTLNSSYKAQVQVTQDVSGAISGTSADYKFTAGATCNATVFDDPASTSGASFNLETPNAPVYVCFKVSADNTMQQGQTGSVVWQFAATSAGAI